MGAVRNAAFPVTDLIGPRASHLPHGSDDVQGEILFGIIAKGVRKNNGAGESPGQSPGPRNR